MPRSILVLIEFLKLAESELDLEAIMSLLSRMNSVSETESSFQLSLTIKIGILGAFE
jgi:hypothetical protein